MSISKHLSNIRHVFNPSVADLVAAFGLSRQAVYRCLNGDAVAEGDWFGYGLATHGERSKHIASLGKAADAFNEAGVMHPSAYLKAKVFGGCSLLDLAADGVLSQKRHVKPLIKEALARDAAYRSSGVTESKAPPTDSWLSELSVPGSIE